MPWKEFTALLLLATAMSFTPGPNTALSTAIAANRGLAAAMRFVVAVPVGWCVLLLLCAAGTTSLPVRLWRKAAQWKCMRIVEPLCIAACIAVITGFLAEGGFDAWFSL